MILKGQKYITTQTRVTPNQNRIDDSSFFKLLQHLNEQQQLYLHEVLALYDFPLFYINPIKTKQIIKQFSQYLSFCGILCIPFHNGSRESWFYADNIFANEWLFESRYLVIHMYLMFGNCKAVSF